MEIERTSPFGLRLPTDLKAWVKAKAKADDRSMNNLLIKIVRDEMEREQMTAGVKASETDPAVIDQNAARQGGFPVTKDERTV